MLTAGISAFLQDIVEFKKYTQGYMLNLSLTLNMLGKNFSRPNFEISFLFFLRKQYDISYKSVSFGDNLLEMTKA